MRVDREVEVGGAQSVGEERTIIEVYIITLAKYYVLID